MWDRMIVFLQYLRVTCESFFAQKNDAMMGVLVSTNATLLGVVITIVALVPTLVEIARNRRVSFLSAENARSTLYDSLRAMSRSIWFFCAGILFSLINIIFFSPILTAFSMLVSLAGLVLLTIYSYRVAKTIISIMV